MTLSERWKAFADRRLRKMMETFRDDPDVSYADWQQLCKNWQETFGYPYTRK